MTKKNTKAPKAPKPTDTQKEEAAKFGFKPHEVLDGTSSDAAAFRNNRWMFG
jgi:hypothetical protein